MKNFPVFFSTVLIAFNSFASISVWDGSRAKFNQGIGIETDPFIISSASEFAYLSDGGNYENKYFSVAVDIDLSNFPWTPIGAFETDKFKGNIDFNGHYVSNLYISGDRAIGLFGYIENASIKNLVIDSSEIHGLNLVGGIVADAVSSYLSNIENHGNVYSTGGFAEVGGIAGKVTNCQIDNVLNYGTVTNNDKEQMKNASTRAYVGGIVGSSISTVISRCANYGNIDAYSVMATARYYVGGIIGSGMGAGGSLSYCFNQAKVSCRLRYVRWYNDGTIAHVGGIAAGFSSDPQDIHYTPLSNCYNSGLVSGCSYWSGCYGAITAGICEQCYSTWAIQGCSASSYTATNVSHNGIKVSMDELNSSAIVKKLNNGNNIFCKDEYPYVNGGLPFFVVYKKYSIVTENPTEISSTSANLKGAIFCTGYEIMKKGFRYCKLGNTYKTEYCFDDYISVDDLLPNTRYSYYFFAELSNGKEIRGENIEFTTSSLLSEIYTLDAEEITDNSVIINGALVLNDSENVLEYGVEYQSADGSANSCVTSQEIFNSPYFQIKLESLTSGTLYRYRTFVKLDKGHLYGEYREFKTTGKSSIPMIESKNDLLIVSEDNCLVLKNGCGNYYAIYSLKGEIIKEGIADNNEFHINLPLGIYIAFGKKFMIPK